MDLHPRAGKWISRRAIRHSNVPSQRTCLDSTRFVDSTEIPEALAGLQRDGFFVFKKVVAGPLVHELRNYAEHVPCMPRGATQRIPEYPRENPTVGRYDIDETTALTSDLVQEFATDPLMALISENYLGQPVVMDEVAFWWTTSQRAEDANLNAQMYHQDRDRLSFLKFFIYLTDVTADTGPHVYIRGSHRHIPRTLRRDGRIDDMAVNAAGLGGDAREICGPAGTLMAVDTIGLHKGKTPVKDDRLALQVEFSTSLFGMNYEILQIPVSDLTNRRIGDMPWTFQRLHPQST